MATTAVMYQYANASVSPTGYVLDLQVLLNDPVTGQRASVTVLAVEIPAGSIASADATIKAAIQAYAVEIGFAEPALNRIFMPKFST